MLAFYRFSALSLILSYGTLEAQGLVQMNVKDLTNRGVQLIPATDASFGSYFASITQSKQADPTLGVEKPFSAILVNKTDRRLYAYSVRYLWVGKDGRTTYHDALYQSLNRDTGYRVNPGGTALLTPGRALTGPPPQPLGPHLKRATALVDQMRRLSAITVVLDCVIYEDGTLVGPDETDAFAQAWAIVNSPRKLMAQLMTLHSDRQADRNTLSWLEQVASMPNDPKDYVDLAHINWDSHFTKQAAASLVRRFKELGPQATYDHASSTLATPALALRRQ